MDSEKSFDDLSIEFQIAEGKYIPQKHPYFTFIDSAGIAKKYSEADVVITHAGAGTIYKLLEIKKRFIVVPNFERIDKHQNDIADFLAVNRYAFVAYSFTQLKMFLDIINSYEFKEYNKESFSKAEEILEFLLS
jgi:beta-1,4-N-acetylglucosaminyltransferase